MERQVHALSADFPPLVDRTGRREQLPRAPRHGTVLLGDGRDKEGKEAKMASVIPAHLSRRDALITEIKKLREKKNTFEWGSDSSHFTYAELQTPQTGVPDGGEQNWKCSSRTVSTKVVVISLGESSAQRRGREKEGQRNEETETAREEGRRLGSVAPCPASGDRRTQSG